MLELKNISKTYPSPGQRDPQPVLDGLSLRIEKGSALAIVGPSGSGKSTLLNIMGALDRPTTGQVIFEGLDLAGLSERQLATIRNEKIGFVFQLHHLLPQCTVLENVLIPTLPRLASKSKQALLDRAMSLLTDLGLEGHLYHRPGQLSGGQRQRVALARALINDPPLLLADEPTGSLDQNTARHIADILAQLNRQQGRTLVVVTHSLELARCIGPVMELRNGKLHRLDTQ